MRKRVATNSDGKTVISAKNPPLGETGGREFPAGAMSPARAPATELPYFTVFTVFLGKIGYKRLTCRGLRATVTQNGYRRGTVASLVTVARGFA